MSAPMQDTSLQLLSCSLANSLHNTPNSDCNIISQFYFGRFLNIDLHAVSTQSGNTQAEFYRSLGPLSGQRSRTSGLIWQTPICVHLDARHWAGGPCLPQTNDLYFQSFMSFRIQDLWNSVKVTVPYGGYSAQNGSHFGKLQCNAPAAWHDVFNSRESQ